MPINNILKRKKSKHLDYKCNIIIKGGGKKMNKKNIKRITSPRYYLIILGILFLVFALISSLAMGEVKKDDNKNPFSYSSIGNTEYDVAGEYVYLDVVDLYQFGIRETALVTEEYFYAFDKDMYLYVVCISDEKFYEIEKIYLEDPDNFSYRLEGYLHDLSGDIKQLAIEMIPQVFGEDWNYVAEQFDDYFLTTYLDTLNNPNLTVSDVIVVSVMYFIMGCIFFVVGILRILKVGKFKQNKEYSNMLNELENPSIWNINAMKLSLTESYLIYYGKKLGFVNYKDISELIYDRNRLVIVTESEVVNVGRCSSTLYDDIKSFIEKKKNSFNVNEI